MSDSGAQDNMVVIARFPSAVEANLAVSKLWAHGIEAEVEPHAAYDTMTHLQIGLKPQGIAVLAPAKHQQEGRCILRDVKAKASADLDVVPNILTRCRRALFLTVCAMILIGPLALLMLLHIRKLKNTLAAEKGQLRERQYNLCAGYLTSATVISIVSGLVGLCFLGVILSGAATHIF